MSSSQHVAFQRACLDLLQLPPDHIRKNLLEKAISDRMAAKLN